jgi:2-phospho-L-lactate/phosphoenolpyruvate guanylyltransferase
VTSPDLPVGAPRIAAIIPVGTLEGAKTRLAGSLDAEERHDLVTGLLHRTVAAALAVEDLSDVVVVSPDSEVLRLAAEAGARTLRQRTRGLNAGLREARADVVAGGADAILIVPVDLPFATAGAIGELVGRLVADGPAVVLVTDRHATGTNALGLRPPDVIDVAFGPDSRAAHRSGAEAAGARYSEVDGPLAIDLDTPEDLVLFETTAPERSGVG